LELRLSGRAEAADKPIADKRVRPFQASRVRLGCGGHRVRLVSNYTANR